MAYVKIFNPNNISTYDIELLIDLGYTFDIVSNLKEYEYDDIQAAVMQALEEKKKCESRTYRT